MNRIRSVLLIAVGACVLVGGRGSSEPAAGPVLLELVTASSPPVAAAGTAGEPVTLAGCPVITADQLDTLVALAIDGMDDTTSDDGWSRTSALVLASDDAELPHVVTIELGWEGTLMEFETAPGADPIPDLADEAYALDAGRRIALRSGEAGRRRRLRRRNCGRRRGVGASRGAQLPD